MTWTIKEKNGKYIVKFKNEAALEFQTKGGALAYVNDRVLTSLGL
jgi:hypothetical protein